MYIFAFVFYVITEGFCVTGDLRTESPSKRFIFDSNHQFTGWASWQQYAACSTQCVPGFESETKQCCETGDNRLCYILPWDKLKPLVGTCPNTTSTQVPTTRRKTAPTTIYTTSISSTTSPSSSAAASTTTTTPPTTTKTTTTTTQRLTTTKSLAMTLPPVTTSCAVCDGPPILCEYLYTKSPCTPPNNYCINKLINHRNGDRTVVRECGNFDTCYREWFQATSDNDRCTTFDENFIETLDFECTFCCVMDNCNEPVKPADKTMYRNY